MDPEDTSVTIQDVDRESMKYIKTERDDPSWAAQEGRLLIPDSNLDLIPGMRSTGTSMDIFVRGVGVGLTHTENLIIKKLRIARETGDLEAETGEEPKKPNPNLDLIPGMRSTGTSMDIFVRGVGVGLTHTENLIKKIENSKRNRRLRSRNRRRT